jgi:hypothetical protein
MGLLSTVRNVAGGRLPPATRFAVLCGFGVFVVGLLIFKPVSGGAPAAKPLTAGAVLLPPGNALAESQALLDPSAAYLPAGSPKSPLAAVDEVQVEDSPLPGFDPILRFAPGKPVDLTLESEKPVAVAPYVAIPLNQWEPFTTLGSANLTQGAIAPRGLYYDVSDVGGAKKSILKGKISNISLKNEKNGDKIDKFTPLPSIVELIIGVDSMGLQAPAKIIRSSGNSAIDAAVVSWSTQVPWAKRLPPGSYRLTVGP